MYKALTHFFELIKVSLGVRDALSAAPTAEEWKRIFFLARKQTLVGVCFTGVERLPAEQRPPKELVLQWFAMTQQIERRNLVMDQRTEQATQFFRSHGFKTAVLKGQGIAQLYPRPERRQSGDIDIWLDGGRERIYAFARSQDKDGKLYGVNYHHIHYHLFEDTEVEAHIYPSYLENPFLNHQLHNFCRQYPPTNEAPTPSLAFNRIFILLHCYNHLKGHGVGLRQVMDYYYVIMQGFSPKEKEESLKWLKTLRLTTFAAAMTWVMDELFDLPKDKWLVEPNEKEGRFLLEEICQTGNMGHYDERNWGSLKTPFSRFRYNLRRDAHFLFHYPDNVLWQPLFNVWLYAWRWCKGLNPE